MKSKILTLSTCILFITCSLNRKSIKNELIGRWAIEKIEFNKKDYKSYLYSNVLIFRENTEISIPETVHFIEDLNSKWKLNNKNELIIESSNLAFKDTFIIKIIDRTKTKPKGIELKSDSIFIKAYDLFDLGK